MLATDPESGASGPPTVERLIRSEGRKTLVRVRVDGEATTATDRHPFWVESQERWRDAQDRRRPQNVLDDILAPGTRTDIVPSGQLQGGSVSLHLVGVVPPSTALARSSTSASIHDELVVPMRPWIRNYRSRSTLEAHARELEGETLTGVEYLFPSSRSSSSPHRRGRIDEVDLGVDFVTAGGSTFRAAWQMFGVDQGLFFGPRSEGVNWPMPVKSSDVSDYELWQPLIGRQVQTVNLAWQLPEEGASESVWAVSIESTEGEVVVVALGTILDAAWPVYQPDGVLVIFDEDVAREYMIPASVTSALGI